MKVVTTNLEKKENSIKYVFLLLRFKGIPQIKWSAFIYKYAEKYFVFENTGELNGPLDVWMSKRKLM
nr:MAG TPA: hypothetical protein [Caudoviricetes sp.]